MEVFFTICSCYLRLRLCNTNMIGLILTLIIGLAIAYFSKNSSSDINIALGDSQYFNIPLYMITVGTYLLGILLAWIIEIPQSIATTFQIMGLGRSVKSGNNTIASLQNKINRLEIENSKLHNHNKSILMNRPTDDYIKPNFIHNILHKLNIR